MKRLQSFTIIELIIAMLLAGVVSLMAYFAYQSINSFFNHSVKLTEVNFEILEFRRWLKSDFYHAEKIYGRSYGVQLISANQDEIKYDFLEDKIIRIDSKNDYADTFIIRIANMKTNRVWDDFELLSEIEFTVNEIDSATLNIIFYKQYDSETLFKEELNFR